MTNTDITRRRAIQLGSAVAISGLSPIAGSSAAQAGPSQVSQRTFSRGINVWPWLAMPLSDPAPGSPYSTWPPYVPNRPIPTSSDLKKLVSAGFDFIRLIVDPAPFLNTAPLSGSNQFAMLFSMLTDAVKQANAAGLGVVG